MWKGRLLVLQCEDQRCDVSRDVVRCRVDASRRRGVAGAEPERTVFMEWTDSSVVLGQGQAVVMNGCQ